MIGAVASWTIFTFKKVGVVSRTAVFESGADKALMAEADMVPVAAQGVGETMIRTFSEPNIALWFFIGVLFAVLLGLAIGYLRRRSCVQEKKVSNVECTSDNDCGVGGCSGQVCGLKDKVKDIITTCEFRESYNCLKLTSCGCVDGKCEWIENQDYKECMEELK